MSIFVDGIQQNMSDRIKMHWDLEEYFNHFQTTGDNLIHGKEECRPSNMKRDNLCLYLLSVFYIWTFNFNREVPYALRIHQLRFALFCRLSHILFGLKKKELPLFTRPSGSSTKDILSRLVFRFLLDCNLRIGFFILMGWEHYWLKNSNMDWLWIPNTFAK